MAQETTDVMVMTKVTASPIERAESIFLDTPRKGHIPKK